MSHLLIVNPNTSLAVTAWLAEAARRAAPAGVETVAVNAQSGLAALQTPEHVETAARAVVQAIAAQGSLRGAVIAAFGDPGLAAARAQCSFPVVGLGTSGLLAAGAGGRRFSILTLGAAMREPIAARAAALGLAAGLVEIEILPFSIPELVADREARHAAVVEAVRRCRAGTVLLAGAPFAGMAPAAAAETGKCVLDGVEAAVAAVSR